MHSQPATDGTVPHRSDLGAARRKAADVLDRAAAVLVANDAACARAEQRLLDVETWRSTTRTGQPHHTPDGGEPHS